MNLSFMRVTRPAVTPVCCEQSCISHLKYDVLAVVCLEPAVLILQLLPPGDDRAL